MTRSQARNIGLKWADIKEVALILLTVGALALAIGGSLYWAYIASSPKHSPDYLDNGTYECPNCGWQGYPGAMTTHDWPADYYCPECGHEIDVRGG